MKVPIFRNFSRTPLTKFEDLVEYLANTMPHLLMEWSTAWYNLKFTDNFVSFKTEIVIPANTELTIRNQFRDGTIPTERLILRGNQYSAYVTDGETEWTKDYLYLKNYHASGEASLTVLFLK